MIGTFSGWDASLHWAQYFDDSAHFRITNITIIPGVEMFINQAALQFEQFTGVDAPVDVMRRVVMEHLES